jgi:hypothetical protein
MAAVVVGSAVEPPREIVSASSRLKLSWGAIFGGMFVALGVWIMLLTLGLAIGLTTVDPNDLSTAKHAATGTGIGSVIALFLSLLVGGLVAARTAGIVDRSTGALHGAVLWGFTTLAGTLLLGLALRAGVGAAANVGSQAVSGASSAVTGVAREGDTLTQALGISSTDLVAPLNRRLRAEGKPPVTGPQIEAAVRDAVSTGIREGRLDKELLVSSLAEQTNLSPMDARELADRVESRFVEKRDELGNRLEHAVGGAVGATSTAMWWTFLAQVIGLASAILGATIGVSRKQRRLAGEWMPGRAPVPLVTTHEAGGFPARPVHGDQG